jgi:uncharacterized membrane protein
MTAPGLVACAWILFAGTHLVLGLPLRAWLVRRLGEASFVALFSAVAALSMGALAYVVAVHGGEGPAGAGLGRWPGGGAALGGLAFLGLTLATAGLLNYMRSPMALFRTQVKPPAGVERITRHPFFVGLTIYAVAHALLAATLATAIYFAGYAALAAGGARLQDRKLVAKHGDAYTRYVARTSFLPFAGLLRGDALFVRGEKLMQRLAVSALVAALVFAAHPWLSAWHGAPLAMLIAGGGLYASGRRWWHSRSEAPGGQLDGARVPPASTSVPPPTSP